MVDNILDKKKWGNELGPPRVANALATHWARGARVGGYFEKGGGNRGMTMVGETEE